MASSRKIIHSRLKQRLFANVRRLSPWITLRILLTWFLFFPWFILTLVISWVKILRWRKPRTCRRFLERHTLAFPEIDPASLRVESISGGVSNSNQVWHVRDRQGHDVRYFVKVFVSIGSFWAKNMSVVSPFPEVYGVSTRERFTVDLVSRSELAQRGISVPRLLAFDAVEQVMVTEFVQGVTVDQVLMEMETRGGWEARDMEVISKSGSGLARIHEAGYSLIDTQPVNCIWCEENQRVYFTDLEYCSRQNRQLWDVGFFLCFIALRLSPPVRQKAREAFLAAYSASGGVRLEGLEATHSALKEYLPILRTILDLRQFTPEELLEEIFS